MPKRNLAILLCLLLPLTACSPKQTPAKADLQATDAAGRVPALVHAAQSEDPDSLAQLIHALSDEDPAVRLFAARSLRERTGQDLGYRYYESPEKRSAAAARWHDWLGEQAQAPATAEAQAETE